MSNVHAAAVRGPRPCSVCDVRLQAPWPFRADDRHCPLCGLRILRLTLFATAPDGNVWLYQGPHGVTFRLVWERGPEDRPERRQTLRPLIDFPRCAARFGSESYTGLEFAVEEADGPEGMPEVLAARLASGFGSFDALPLPPQGVPGQLVLATAAGTETRPALLLPPPGEPTVECSDPSVEQHNGAWHLFQQGTTVTLPLTVSVPVAQWVLSASADADVHVRGFESPVLLPPGRPHAFEISLPAAGWDPQRPRDLTLMLQRAALDPLALSLRLVLVPGSTLQYAGGNRRTVEVRLGRRVTLSLPLTVTASPIAPRPLEVSGGDLLDTVELTFDEEDEALPQARTTIVRPAAVPEPEAGITITDFAVHEAEPGGWLRVLRPRHEQLPWLLTPAGPGQLPDQLDLEIDTTRLDRERFAGAALRGAVELIDSRRRRWRCEIQANVARPQRLASWVAFDWGTTNSCAAYRKGVNPDEQPLSICFDDEQRHTPELFPSDLYFEDLSDPQHPVFHLGHDAARRAREHPECCLRSVKRKFQFQERLFVMDERQRGHTYTTAELARLVLRKLIAMAEDTLGHEIHHLGITFPTKWSARVRHKLEAVTRALEADLQRERRPFRVTFLPPAIDEANAVAFDLITSAHGREDLPETFHLIAYDFGGGTVDTSVLEVYLPQDMSGVRTRYIGLGGRGDFGGDDVTRAVMTLVRDRIADALQRRNLVLDAATGRSVRLLQLPVVADGEPLRPGGRAAAHLHQLGRKNWDALWKIAELIKIDLCDAANPAAAVARGQATMHAPAGHAPGVTDFGLSLVDELEEDERTRPAADDRHPATDRLRPRLGEIACRVLIQPGPGVAGQSAEDEWSLDKLLDPLDADERDAFFRELGFTLDEACDYPLEDIFETNAGQRYSVRQRVEDTVRELQVQCADGGIRPDIIVLAGGGCRLPLVAQLMTHYFPSDRGLLHYDRAYAKRRVAHGMASFLALRQVMDLDHQLARCVDVLHHPLGVQRVVVEKRVVRTEFVTVVPVGAPLDDAAVAHAFRFTAAQLLATPEGGRRLALFVRDWRKGPLELGHFDVTGGADPLPVAPGAAYDGELRLRGARRVELTVTHEGAQYGPYRLMLAAHDPEAVLQSEDPLSTRTE